MKVLGSIKDVMMSIINQWADTDKKVLACVVGCNVIVVATAVALALFHNG